MAQPIRSLLSRRWGSFPGQMFQRQYTNQSGSSNSPSRQILNDISSPKPTNPARASNTNELKNSEWAMRMIAPRAAGTQAGLRLRNDYNRLTNASMDTIQEVMHRPWQAGDIYAPHDLKPSQMKAWATKKQPPGYDLFELMALNPKKQYMNVPLLTEFVTELGRIKPAKQTGLRRKNQRQVARAIRRAVGVGLMPSTYHHPEILKNSWQWGSS